MKTVANLFSTAYTRLGADYQKDRHFMTIERLSPEEDGYCTYVKSVEGLAQNEYWIAREKNLLMLLKKTPHVVRLRREEEKTSDSYQTVKTKDAGISLAHWLRTKPTLAANKQELKHPLEPVGAFLNFTKYCLTALKGLHQAGVIHANLRADNICIPYAPRPYEFDTEVKLDFEGLALIDFMFSISSTLKLSRPLPVSSITAPSSQSSLLLNALIEDRKNRNTDCIQRLDYSVDLYALSFILDQIFQQNLRYPEGLDAELSMEIHHFIHELKRYESGIPENIKMHYLHLLPHDDYIQRIEHLLSLDYRSTHADSQLFTLDPAQFLEDDSQFSTHNGLLLAPELENNQLSQNEPLSQLPVSTHIETTIMKDTMPAPTPAKDNTAESFVEIEKSIVIALIITAQLLFFVFQEGNRFGLDVLSTMGLILLIGISTAFAGKLLTPKPVPRLRPIIIESNSHDTQDDETTPKPQTATLDEFDIIAASVASASLNAVTTPENTLNTANTADIPELVTVVDTTPVEDNNDAIPIVTTRSDDLTTSPEVTAIELAPEPTKAPQETAVLLKTASAPVPVAKEESIELNKWAVIAVILIFQIGYFFLTTDISSHTTTSPVATNTPEPVAVPTTTPEPEVATPEPTPTEPAPTEDTAAANIALLNEKTVVTTPQVTTHKTAVIDNAAPVTPTTEKAKKVPAIAKEKPSKAQTTAKEEATATETNTPAPVAAATPTPAPATATPPVSTDAKADSKPAANKSLTRGLAEAQNTMGWHYYHGDGVKQDYEEAFKWFQKAANLGEPSAQFNVGMMYAAGTGIKQDFSEAAKWYKKAAEQGKTSAQLNLGMMYISGRGIRQNLPEGMKWLTKAADQGDTTAKANLTWLSQQGYLDKINNGNPPANVDSNN